MLYYQLSYDCIPSVTVLALVKSAQMTQTKPPTRYRADAIRNSRQKQTCRHNPFRMRSHQELTLFIDKGIVLYHRSWCFMLQRQNGKICAELFKRKLVWWPKGVITGVLQRQIKFFYQNLLIEEYNVLKQQLMLK